MKIKYALVAVLVTASSAFSQSAGNSALAALQAIPDEYQDTVVKLSCTGASPNPEKWEALAYDGEVGDAPRNIVLSAGEVISDSLSAKLGTMLSHETAIQVGNVLLDSPAAFDAAASLCSAKGMEMTSANMTLTQPGEGATPVWEIVCLGSGGKRLGKVTLSAENGSPISESF